MKILAFVLLTDGGFAPDGSFRPLAWFDSRHVERLFRAELLRMLLGRELITEAIVDNLLSWRHSGFSAHGAVRVEDRRGAVRLGRYMIRFPIVLERLGGSEETREVIYRGRPWRRAGSQRAVARWDVLDFLARVVDHIPEPSPAVFGRIASFLDKGPSGTIRYTGLPEGVLMDGALSDQSLKSTHFARGVAAERQDRQTVYSCEETPRKGQ